MKRIGICRLHLPWVFDEKCVRSAPQLKKTSFLSRQNRYQPAGEQRRISVFHFFKAMQQQPPLQSKDPVNKSVKKEVSGHDLQLFINKQAAKPYICPLCYKICRDAVELSCTTNIYCEHCLAEYFGSHEETCPLNHPLKCTFGPSDSTRKQVGRLQVKCPSLLIVELPHPPLPSNFTPSTHTPQNTAKPKPDKDQPECEWEGLLKDMIKHQESGCLYRYDATVTQSIDLGQSSIIQSQSHALVKHSPSFHTKIGKYRCFAPRVLNKKNTFLECTQDHGIER